MKSNVDMKNVVGYITSRKAMQYHITEILNRQDFNVHEVSQTISMDDVPSGDSLFWTEDTGYFITSKEVVLNAFLHTNRNLMLRGYTTVYEFYEFLGITDLNKSDDVKNMGWTYDDLAMNGYGWLDIYTDVTLLDDGRECRIFSYCIDPVYLEEEVYY